MTQALTFKRLSTAALALVVTLLSFTIAPFASAEVIEETSSIGISGQLIELSSTEAPTTIIVRDNEIDDGVVIGWVDYTINVTVDTVLGSNTFNASVLDAWIPGDSITITGTYTDVVTDVTASYMVNNSLAGYRGHNGWIDTIDLDAGTVGIQWNDEVTTFNITDDTRMVVPPINPAALSDFEIGDRVRARVINGTSDLRTMLILRRGPKIYNLARTRGFFATILEVDQESNTMNVQLNFKENPHLEDGDVNNLVGVEGDILTITWDADTQIIRKFHGTASEDELTEGDSLRIVGRVDDDGTISARVIKNTSTFARGVGHHLGSVTVVDADSRMVTIESSDGVAWTVTLLEDGTVYVDSVLSTLSDIEIGDKLTVRGTANNSAFTIDARTIRTRDTALERLEEHRARIIEIFEEVEDFFEEEGAEIDAF